MNSNITTGFTPGMFAEFAKNYEKVLYTNVLSAARMFFSSAEVLDLCCGPGLMAERLSQDGYRVTLFDQHPEYLDAASERVLFPADIVQGDARTRSLPQVENAIFINASGYFSLAELKNLLRRLPSRRLIVNFLVEEDQEGEENNPFWVRKAEGNLHEYDMNGEPLVLQAITESQLAVLLAHSKWECAACFHYFDFKRERLLCLERKTP